MLSPSPRSEFLGGVRAELPILLGTVPFGIIYGVLALGAGISPGPALAMSSIVFAGSAQFVTAQLIGAGTPAVVIIATAAIINLRHALYSASVAPYIYRLPLRWKALLAYLLTDEAYAVAITHFDSTEHLVHTNWYFLGAGLTLWSSWQLSTAAGILLGAHIPDNLSLDFTLPLTFIALVIPALRDRGAVAAATVAGVVAVAGIDLPFKLNLVVAAAAGILAGLLTEHTP